MTSPQPPDHQPWKLLAGGTIKIRIALLSGLVLVLGAWLAPRSAQTTLSAPQELSAPLLEEQVQISDASRTFVGVQAVAAEVRDYSVAIQMPTLETVATRNDFSEPGVEAPQVAGFGVFVSDRYVLTHSVALAGRPSAQVSTGTGRTFEGRVVAYEPPTGLVLLQTEPSERPPAILANEAPVAGALAVGVGRSDGLDVAVPVFVTRVSRDRYAVGTVNESILPGMPLFNLAGELFAIAVPGSGGVLAVPVGEAAARLIARASAGERRTSLGLGFQAPSGLLAQVFGERGVVINEVLEGGPADLAGIQVGDVLLAVGDVDIDSVETATRVLGAGEVSVTTPLRIRRAGRVRDIEATPALAYGVAALAQAGGAGASGPEARMLFAAPLLERWSIPPSARVLSINGKAVTARAQAQRALRAARTPLPVLLRQGGNQFFVAVEPAR